MRKSSEATFPSNEQIEADIRAIDLAIDQFANAMKQAMAVKAREGRIGWDNPQYRQEKYEDLLAHAVVAGSDPRQFVHIANYAMMLNVQSTGAV